MVPWLSDMKGLTLSNVLPKLQRRFLWLSLVLKELASRDTSDDFDVIKETPRELVDANHRIEMGVTQNTKTA
jgi:hypothetical protein